jgi:hypothetical protein
MMRKGLVFIVALTSGIVLTTLAWSGPQDAPGPIKDEIARVAQIEMRYFEDTKKARNERLNQLFRNYAQQRGGTVTAETVRDFNALLKQHGLSNFDDFRAAEMAPLRYKTDPATGAQVPLFGPLGTDAINSWLGDLDILSGKPADEQPVYKLAANALREHLDFALIGLRDPNLSLEQLPPKLRENAADAYRRLNPTNKWDGGFDHPLYYATVREAAKKLFRKDYPHLKVTLADVVVPEKEGGFGIRSCLLCHNRDHTGVYQRLLGQGLYLEARAAELPQGSDKAAEARKNSAVFLRAAETVQKSFPDKVDAKAARKTLAALASDNLARLRPGFADFTATLNRMGCLNCHSKQGQPPADKNPGDYGAFVLDLNGYHQTAGIKALIKHVDLDDVGKSKLLLKAMAKVTHEGADDVKLDANRAAELRAALNKWVSPFNSAGTAPSLKP